MGPQVGSPVPALLAARDHAVAAAGRVGGEQRVRGDHRVAEVVLHLDEVGAGREVTRLLPAARRDRSPRSRRARLDPG